MWREGRERAIRASLAPAVCALMALSPVALARADPIPSDPVAQPPPAFEGGVPAPRRLVSPEPPRHPFMAPNGRSNLHNDGFQTDAYRGAGPLGRGLTVSSTFEVADCASVTFDSKGRIVTICVGIEAPRLKVFDPDTLETLASMTLPPRNPGTGSIFNDFSGGGYFYLDHRDRAIFATNDRRLMVVAVRDAPAGGVNLVTERVYDLTGAVPGGDKIVSALPDWSGLVWFVSVNGVVGTVDVTSGAVRSRPLGEAVSNSFAVDDAGAVYVVTQRALYRLEAGGGGTPETVWREEYRNSGIAKPGQVHAGSGTTPTVMAGGRIAITDNADPMNVVVMHRGATVPGSRLICEEPVFRKGASATDNSLIAARNSLVVENNYGYTGPAATQDGATTEPGLARVDVRRDNRGCRTVWRSQEIAPTVVPKLSLENGLVYTYTKPPRADGVDAWYFTALDFCTGVRQYRRLTGTGLGFNNNYAPVSLAPDGDAYVGVLGGLVRIADSTPPTGPPRGTPRGCKFRPRLALRLRARRGRGCLHRPIAPALVGKDRALVQRVRFRVGRRTARARVTLRGGRVVRLRKPFRLCRR